MKHIFLCASALLAATHTATPAAAQTVGGQTCTSVIAVGDVAQGTQPDIIVEPLATPGSLGQPVDCVLSRQPGGQVELVAVEHIPVQGGQVQVIYRDTQVAARLLGSGEVIGSPLAACFDDTPVAGEFECESSFHATPEAALFERTYSDFGNLVGLNVSVAPRALYDGTVFNMELGRAEPEDIRVRLQFPQSGVTLRLSPFPGGEPMFGLIQVEDMLALNTALDVPGVQMIIEVSANRGSFYEQYPVAPDDLSLRMRAMSSLTSLMLPGA